ncbi:alpha/beta hydrolase [Crocosphaera sp. Alani8]|uniref:alpha/beta hydrolase n=1 Tax=Crocosphaera sp. Alani8 TaxID=3038952 RepID=UPI00313BBC42
MLNRAKITPLLLGCLLTFLSLLPVKAAEKLYLSYGPLLLSLRIESLEIFAKHGIINEDLRFYLDKLTTEQQDEFRSILVRKLDINPVLISRFFNSSIGENMLTIVGDGVTIQGGINGKYALRGAMVSASLDPEGLTLLNVLKKYPTNIQLQGDLLEGLEQKIKHLILATDLLVTNLEQWTTEEVKTTPSVDYSLLKDLRKPGDYKIIKQVWQLTDKSRERSFYVDVYIPQTLEKQKIPVFVFSHGLSSRPEDYSQLLKHLASYGYLVAAPQHPGSDTIYLQEMFKGYHRNIFALNDFIDRPLDISYVIDELERRNVAAFLGQLDLDNVGVGGHSFGGYTVLALAGATIDFENLQQDCSRFYHGIDIALLLECRALKLPRTSYNFRDNRVKAVLAENPVNRSIFGQKGLSNITIPIILSSGSNDPAAPPVLEQAASFTWLTTPDKYWMLIEGQAHVDFSQLDGQIKQTIDSLAYFTFPSQKLINSYVDAMSIAFFEVYIQNNPTYLPYLQSSYAQYLSQGERFKLDFITNHSSHKLVNTLEEFKQEYGGLK